MEDPDYQDPWTDLVIDQKGKVKPPKRKPVGRDYLLDADKALPKLMLEEALSKAEMHEIITCDAYSLFVQPPSQDWVVPIYFDLKARADWDDGFMRTSAHRARADDSSAKLLKALAQGGRVFAVSQNKNLFSRSLVTTADRVVVLQPPTPELLAKVIKAVTGKLPIDVPANLGAGLGFDELVSCMRRGTTAAECIHRIKAAMKAKTGPVDDSVPELKDLHGYGAAMTWCRDLVVDFDAWRRGEIAWAEVSAAAVWTSPPGLGKTSLARSLAKSLGVPLVATSVAQWFSQGSGYLDSIIKQIDELFAEGRAQAPCCILLDEIDAIPSRIKADSRNADYWGVVITHLLTTLDGAIGGQNEGIVLIGATNHASRLDPALVRPGRFSKIIEIDPPDERALAGIFRQHLGDDLAGEDLTGPARLAIGSTGAQVVDLVKSARRSARSEKRSMQMRDLMDAIAPPDERSPELIERIAIHESGHAVLAHVLGTAEVTAVNIVQRGSTGGYVMVEREAECPSRADIERAVIQMLGGRAAEEVITGVPSMGAGGSGNSDLARATRLIGALHLSGGLGENLRYTSPPDDVPQTLMLDGRAAAAVESELRSLYAEALRLVRVHADCIVAVAEEVMAHRHIDRAQFLAAIASVTAPREWPVDTEGAANG